MPADLSRPMSDVAATPATTTIGFDLASLDALFAPRSIAIVGASQDSLKIGGRPVDYLKRHGFAGQILPVNPGAASIQGLPAVARLDALGKPCDVVIISVPAAGVLDTVEQAASLGVRGLVIFSSGFAEVDDAGARLQTRIATIARDAGMRILGPNCIGYVNKSVEAYASFSPVIGMGVAGRGPVGIVTQSGAFGAFAYTLARERGLGLSKWIATGNEADVDVADCIAWLAHDDETRVILAYLEGARDGRRLMAALEMARARGKPVVVTKVGRSEIGAAAAASHTAAMAGQDAVWDALLRQSGAWRSRSVEAFFDVGQAAAIAGLPASRSLGLVTVSGGVGVLMADDAADAGLLLDEMPAAAQAAIKAEVAFAATRNPLDITGQVANDPTLLERSILRMLEGGGYRMLASFTAGQGLTPAARHQMPRMVSAIRDRHPDVMLAVCSVFVPELRRTLEAMGVLVFEDPSRMIATLGALAWLADAHRTHARVDGQDAPILPTWLRSADGLSERLKLPSGLIDEPAALALLREAGVPVMPFELATTANDAVAAAGRLGYPVALKVVSADIVHKTDAGGVCLNLADDGAVRAAWASIEAAVATRAPGARIRGQLVAPMVTGGVQCIAGVQHDPVFGPVLMFGLGGVFVEVLDDVVFRAAPIDLAQAHGMIDEIRGRRLLDGVRGAPAGDRDALAQALVNLSLFAARAGEQLQSVELNPLVVLPRGQGVVALDAVMLTKSLPSNSHLSL